MKANVNMKLINAREIHNVKEVKSMIDKSSSQHEVCKLEDKITSEVISQSENFKKRLDEKRQKSSKLNLSKEY